MSAPDSDYNKQLTTGAWFNAARVPPEDGKKVYLWFGHTVKVGQKRSSYALFEEGKFTVQMVFSYVIAWKEIEK